MTPQEPSEPANPHDALFRKTFSVVEHAAAELQSVLPAALVASVNWPSLRLIAGSFVDTELASSQSDLLFAAEIGRSDGFVYLLFEHQSTVDELMAFRILKYVVRILDRHVQDSGGGRNALPLPLVVPVVLHHSAQGWTAPTQLEALFDSALLREPSVVALIPRLDFVLDDISHLSDHQLTQRFLDLIPTLALWALRDARRPGRVQSALAHWGELIHTVLQAENGREALLPLFRYLSLVVEDLTPQTLLAAIAPATNIEETPMTTMAERWRAEGEARGEAKGKAEGARQLLIQLLELKFGPLSPEQRNQVALASDERLASLTTQFLHASSLSELLSD